jgi:hypothetical protein
MSQRVSRLSAQRVDRPVLAPDWLIAVLTCMVAGGLWLLYPRLALERRLAEAADTPLSVAYLNNLLRSDPQNPGLRLLLARNQILHGDMDDARTTLAPALASGNPVIHKDALWTLWELQHTQYLRTPETRQRERNQQLAELRALLKTLAAEQWPLDRQRRLAALAAQFGDADLRKEMLNRLAQAQTPPQEAAAFYVRAALDALATGDYAGSAELYLLARRTTTDAVQSKNLFHEALRTLRSGNQPAAALAVAERELGDLADDPDTLFLLIEIARAAGRPDVADHYARRLLHLSLLQQWQAPLAHLASAAAPALYDDGASLLEGSRARRAVSNCRLAPEPSETALHTPGAAPDCPAGPQMLSVALPAASAGETPRSPGLPYNEKAYALGYQVFLENGKPEDAWAVARAAVQQDPTNLTWRERLAQVSEWTQRPALALAQWLVIARQTQTDQAWQAVLRLAPGLFEDGALVEALYYQLRRKPGDMALVNALVQAHERLGDPGPALAYLQQHAHSPEALELLAWLAERAGQPDAALQAWRRLFSDPAHITPARAVPAAVLALMQGLPDEGLRWMEAAQQHLPAEGDQSEFWRLTGQIAESRQRRSLAITAYRQLAAAPEAPVGDLDALIRQLLPDHPLEAAQVALRAWERHDQARHLIQALTLYSSRGEWAPFDRVLAMLDPAPAAPRRALRTLWRMPEYLRLMGSHHQNAGRLAQARQHLLAGLAASPDSADMQSALLWLLIDSNDAAALRELLARHEVDWSRQASMHDALASSYQALSQPQVALERYLTPQVQARQDDFLWMMNYADALDQNQQPDRAWQLRRQLLRQQWQALAASSQDTHRSHAQVREQWLTQQGLDATRRVARARLVLTQNPGDPAHGVLRELLRLDLDGQGQLSNAAAETAIGWLQDQGQYSAERALLWHQYARSRSLRTHRPLWADITVALAEDDRMSAGALLQAFDERLPRYDRVNAARAVGDLRTAQTAAFDTQHAQHDDQPLHLQLTESLLAFSDHAGFSSRHLDLSGLSEVQSGAAAHLAISPRLALDVEWNSIRRKATDTRVVDNPPQERTLGMRLHWNGRDAQTRLGWMRREGWRDTTAWQLAHEQRLDSRLTLLVEGGFHQNAEDSLALRLAGMKNLAGLGLRYQFSRLDNMLLSYQAEQYHLQTGQQLGSGRHGTLRYTHAYRLDQPQLEFSAFGSYHAYRMNTEPLAWPALDFLPPGAFEGPGTFLPRSFGFYGIEVATNMRQEQDYTRALRPFASIGRTWHTRLGPGYGIRLGIAGSVLGTDHFSLALVLGKSGPQSQDRSREMHLRYRLHF